MYPYFLLSGSPQERDDAQELAPGQGRLLGHGVDRKKSGQVCRQSVHADAATCKNFLFFEKVYMPMLLLVRIFVCRQSVHPDAATSKNFFDGFRTSKLQLCAHQRRHHLCNGWVRQDQCVPKVYPPFECG